jgi:hypothetical protein
LLDSGLQLGILRVCAISGAPGNVVLPDGSRVVIAPVLERLVAAGVGLRTEWLLGAPGVDVAGIEETWSRWPQVLSFAPCIGVRQFHWNTSVPQARFTGLPVTFTAQEDRDLARSLGFTADATLVGAALSDQLRLQALRLVHADLRAPGRVAGASVLSPGAPTGHGPKVVLAPACAVVELPLGIDGREGATVYAAHLGTGSVIALDARLAPTLLACAQGLPSAEAFAPMAPTLRARLVPALIAKGILLGGET